MPLLPSPPIRSTQPRRPGPASRAPRRLLAACAITSTLLAATAGCRRGSPACAPQPPIACKPSGPPPVPPEGLVYGTPEHAAAYVLLLAWVAFVDRACP